MRLPIAALLLCSGACQCLVPVEEGSDGGADAGVCGSAADCPKGSSCSSGAPFAQVARCTNGRCGFVEAVCPPPDGGASDAGPGLDAGAGCSTAAQCSGAAPTTNWCYQSDAGFSCIEGACVWECPLSGSGRNCTIDGGCLACTGQTACPRNCAGPGSYSPLVEPGSACTVWPGTAIPFTQVTVMRTASAQCHYLAYQPGGGEQLGELWRLSDDEYLAWFPSFGGWCTGRSAYTGVPRGIFNCPACQFVLEGFE